MESPGFPLPLPHLVTHLHLPSHPRAFTHSIYGLREFNPRITLRGKTPPSVSSTRLLNSGVARDSGLVATNQVRNTDSGQPN